MENYYQILGVSRNVTRWEIRSAYKRCKAEWEKGDQRDTQAYMKIEEAYENLGDKLRRGWYDESLDKKENATKKAENIATEHDDDAEPLLLPFVEREYIGVNNNRKYVTGGVTLAAFLYFIFHILHVVHIFAPGSGRNPNIIQLVRDSYKKPAKDLPADSLIRMLQTNTAEKEK